MPLAAPVMMITFSFSCKKKSKEVFILSRIKNYSNKEIADELNVSIETVKYHITYALKFMRTYLGEFN